MEHYEAEIALELINEPPNAMRTEIDRDEVFELAKDIRQNGLINPITVRPVHHDDGSEVCFLDESQSKCVNANHQKYEVVAGHRRFLAHRFGGMSKIKCIVRDLSDDAAFAIMTSENLARSDVNPVDEAIHTARIVERQRGDIVASKKILGRSQSWVEDRLKIAAMQPELQDALRAGHLKIGAAIALARITNDLDRETCIQMAKSSGASIVLVNYWVAQWEAGLFGTAREETAPDSNLPEGERRIITLECAVDGKRYPVPEMRSVMVHQNNVGILEVLRKQLAEQEREELNARRDR